MRSIKHIGFFISFISIVLLSCSKKNYLSFTNMSRQYIKTDSTLGFYRSYNEDMGLQIQHINVDSIYSNKKTVWIYVSVAKNKKNGNICLYSCTKSRSQSYILNRKLRCINDNQSAKIKMNFNQDTLRFIGINTLEQNKAIVYEITGISKN